MPTVSELTHGTLAFSKYNPKNLEIHPEFNIPGSSAFESRNSFGQFFYEYSEQKQFSIWRSIYAPEQDITLQVKEDRSWLGFRLMMKKHIRHLVNGHIVNLMQGQLNFAYTPIIDNSFQLKKGEIYEVFDMSVTPALLKKIKIRDQQFQRFLEQMGTQTVAWITEKPAWGNVIVLDVIEYLTKAPTKEVVAEELIRLVISTLVKKREPERKITERQLENLFFVRDEIKRQFSEQMHLQEWTAKALMNVTYFKEMFRQVFELTPYHYLLYERIKAAKEIMRNEPNLNFSEVATRCGFTTYNNLRRAFNSKENRYFVIAL